MQRFRKTLLGSLCFVLLRSTYVAALSAVVYFVPPAVAAGEGAKFNLKDMPVITRAEDFVEEINKPFSLGEAFTLTRKTTPSARRIRESDFQVRIFRLSPGKYEPSEWGFFDPCYVYLSTVIPVKGSSDLAIHLGTLKADTWLQPGQGGLMENGRYLLVFEQLVDRREVFRLHKNHKDEYFKSALYIEVKPLRKLFDYSPVEVSKLAADLEQGSKERQSEIQLNIPSLPCYRYKVMKVSGHDTEVELAFLAPCEAETLVTDTKGQ